MFTVKFRNETKKFSSIPKLRKFMVGKPQRDVVILKISNPKYSELDVVYGTDSKFVVTNISVIQVQMEVV